MLIACRKKPPKKTIQLPCPRSFQQIRHIYSELAPFFYSWSQTFQLCCRMRRVLKGGFQTCPFPRSCFLDSGGLFDSYVSYIWRHIISSPRLYVCTRIQACTQILLTCLSEAAAGRRDGYAPLGPGCVYVYIAVRSLPVMIQASTCIAWAFKSFRDSLVYMCVHCRRSTVLWHAC